MIGALYDVGIGVIVAADETVSIGVTLAAGDIIEIGVTIVVGTGVAVGTGVIVGISVIVAVGIDVTVAVSPGEAAEIAGPSGAASRHEPRCCQLKWDLWRRGLAAT